MHHETDIQTHNDQTDSTPTGSSVPFPVPSLSSPLRPLTRTLSFAPYSCTTVNILPSAEKGEKGRRREGRKEGRKEGRNEERKRQGERREERWRERDKEGNVEEEEEEEEDGCGIVMEGEGREEVEKSKRKKEGGT
ncbi:hypothetical protein E2C01_066727 [Portunus trituberculatus]|uniref:Uncharacterized protein n=1 Tax=Portunus trituberculatus TaxID=210409 RepID=A0A5B7HMB2_PORTR|nr:hypothetical protein [Portunus trituberculatus]